MMTYRNDTSQTVGFKQQVSFVDLLVAGLGLAGFWADRARQRQHLAGLDARLLRDIGVSPADARAERAKPFWKR